MRVLKRNQTVELKYANKLVGEIVNDYGETQSNYSEISTLRACLIPIDNQVDAEQYGVDIANSYKVILGKQGDKFNKDTRIWIKNIPSLKKNNNDYKVIVAPIVTINESYMVITKKAGR